MKSITLHQLNEFQDFINEKIKRDSFEYKYLINCLDLVFCYQELEIDLNSQILLFGEKWIIYIETPNNLFLYGDYEKILLNELSDKIDLKKYKGKEIMGTFDLVYYLVRKSNLQDYKIIKDRLMYSTNLTEYNLENASQLAKMDDLEKLISLHQAYYNEEYSGKRDKSADFLREGIRNQIENNKIYIIKEKSNIIAFCSIINPDIGILYTSLKHRGKGFAKQLLFTCTKQLLNKNKMVYLLTDMHNLESNKVCESIGFKSYYKHTNLIL